MSSPATEVFVYGTLLRGGSNHFRMAGAEFLAAAMVKGRLHQIDWYPGLMCDETGGEIAGEIYQVPPAVLEELDLFEGAEYRRVQTLVRLPDGEIVSAWVREWLRPVDETRRIKGGDWLGAL